MVNLIHRGASVSFLLCILTFFLSTLISLIFSDTEGKTAVKELIVFPGLILLVLFAASTGISGYLLSVKRTGRLITKKMNRMRLAAANGVLVLIPCAFALRYMAMNETFDTIYYLVQALELMAGLLNITLLTLNIRDGRRLSAQR